MPRRGHHEPAPPTCYCCDGCDGGYAPAPCYYPPPVPAPCYYPAPVPVPAPAPAPVAPSSSTSDHLLHAIVAQLLLGSSAPAPAAPAPQPQQTPSPHPAAHHAANPYPHPHHYQYQYQYQQQEAKSHTYAHPAPAPPTQQHQPQPGASDHGHLLLHSLLRRIAALESALPRCFPPPPPARRTPHPNPRPRRLARQELVDDDEEEEEESPPSPPPRRRQPPPRPTRAGPSYSARERAARTIQAHFRRFLARRSRTLRQLKELAVLRSKSAALRGSLSGRRCGADPAAVSEAAMGLLFRLDAIQGGDPMIREGKRAVSQELTRILEYVDKVLVKEHGQLATGDALDSDGYHEGCSAEFMLKRPSMNRKVSFSSNGRIHELNGETDNVKKVDAGYESSSSAESQDVKGNPGKSANGKPGLAAPTPAHKETRRVAGERR